MNDQPKPATSDDWQLECAKALNALAAERKKVQTLLNVLTGIRDAEAEADPVAFKGTIDMIDNTLSKL